MLDLEALGEVCSKCLNPESLGRIMPGCEVIHLQLTRLVGGLLGDFAAEKGVGAEPRRRLDVTLRCAGTPGQGIDWGVVGGDVERLATEGTSQELGEISGDHGTG